MGLCFSFGIKFPLCYQTTSLVKQKQMLRLQLKVHRDKDANNTNKALLLFF